ncbi:MAG: NUDIX domain-containing protein [Candidatus Moranbacteria bacterium]|nr:NUDIX domain-containing protein [Candidatus Moranbacteria bacterium]
MPFERSVGAVVFRREKDKILYLLIQHPNQDNYQGHWDFPKGHIEAGETKEDALRREVREETGIEDLAIVPGFSAWISYFYRAKAQEKEKRREIGRGINIFKIVDYFLAETHEKEVKLSFEHVDSVWLEFEAAKERITFQKSKNIIARANEFLAKEK